MKRNVGGGNAGAFGDVELFFEPANAFVVVALIHKNKTEVGYDRGVFSVALHRAVDLDGFGKPAFGGVVTALAEKEGAEVAVGLAILVSVFRNVGSIDIANLKNLKG